MENYYYLNNEQQRIGPLSWDELLDLHLPSSTYVWYEGLSSWVRLSTLTTTQTNSNGFFKHLTLLRILLLVYAALGSLFALFIGRFIIAKIAASSYDGYPDQTAWIILFFCSLPLLLFLFIKKRKYFIHALLILAPFWIGSFSSGIYYGILSSTYSYEDGFCEIRKPFQKKGVINEWGIECVPCIYDDVGISDSYPKYCTIESYGKWGICDMSGNIILPCEWDVLYRNQWGLWTVENGGKYGLLHKDGSVLLPCEYDFPSSWKGNSNLIEVEKDGKFGIINRYGEWVLECRYHRTKFKDNGLAKLNQDGYVDNKNIIRGGNWGVINRKGEVIIPCIYDKIEIFSDEIDCYLYGNPLGRTLYLYDLNGNPIN